MIRHHPDINLLAEFAAGTLDTAQAVAISSHLHYCHHCRQTVKQLEQIAGAMLANLPSESIAEIDFEHLMAQIEKTDQQTAAATVGEPNDETTAGLLSNMPAALQRLLAQQPLKWRKSTKALRTAALTTGQQRYELSLQKIQAGGTVPEHDHRGCEMTVILKGSFSDKNGIYQTGDFLLKQPGEVHQPVSAHNEDCLCLAVQEAPVKLTGFWGKLVNPFLRIHAH